MIPKPRLVLQIGISGHRLNKLPPATHAAIRARLSEVQALVTAVAGEIAAGADRLYAPDPPLLRLVSGLAEGADRIAIEAAPAGWEIAALLPMPREEYARDFDTGDGAAESRAAFERHLTQAVTVTELPLLDGFAGGDPTCRGLQYAAMGTFLVRQSDLLIAVWDGDKAAGAGGTGTVVAEALGSGRDVVWIDSRSAEAHLLAAGADGGTSPAVPLERSRLEHRLRALLMPADPAAQAAGHGSVAGALFECAWPRPMRFAVTYPLLRALCGAGEWKWPIVYPSREELTCDAARFFEATPHGRDTAGDFDDRVRTTLLPRSIWADALAWSYGQTYRSAYVWVFALAGIAVPLGLTYLFFLESPEVLGIKAGFVVAELLLILAIVAIVRRGVAGQWHMNWIEARELAEMLRIARSLAYLGALRDLVGNRPEPGERGTNWYARATFREIGLPNAILDSAYLRQLLRAAVQTEIAGQRAYHAANARQLAAMHHKLHHASDACFVATVVLLGLYLAGWGLDRLLGGAAASAAGHGQQFAIAWHHLLGHVYKPIVSVAAAGLPAIGAALSGIRAQGDFEGSARRSAATERELAAIERAIAAADDDGTGTPPDLARATDLLLDAARVMVSDVGAWRHLYVGKLLSLPN